MQSISPNFDVKSIFFPELLEKALFLPERKQIQNINYFSSKVNRSVMPFQHIGSKYDLENILSLIF